MTPSCATGRTHRFVKAVTDTPLHIVLVIAEERAMIALDEMPELPDVGRQLRAAKITEISHMMIAS